MGQAEIEGPRLVDALFSGRGPSGDARASRGLAAQGGSGRAAGQAYAIVRKCQFNCER